MKVISTHGKDVVHIHNGILLSHIKEPNCAICRHLDGPRDSGISQNEKNKCHILTYVCGIHKNGIDDLICKREIENRHMDTSWGKGAWDELEGWDFHIYTQLILCIK